MKPTLLLITGWAHSKESLQPLADSFSAEFQPLISTSAELLNQKKTPDAAYIIAHSMGGLLAIEHLPKTCKKLILLSSTACFCATKEYPFGVAKPILRRMIRQFKSEPNQVLNTFFENTHYPDQLPEPQNDFPSEKNLLLGLEYLQNTDLRTQISKLSIPVLLLHGTRDQIIPFTASEWLNQHLPNSTLHLFQEAGHALVTHQFDEVKEKIESFLSKK